MNTSLVAKQYKLNEWAMSITDYKNSGLSVTEWCNKKGVTKSAYYYRLKKLREACIESIDSPVSGPIPLSKIVDVNPESEVDNYITITCNKLSIHVSNFSSMPLLESVLKVISNV